MSTEGEPEQRTMYEKAKDVTMAQNEAVFNILFSGLRDTLPEKAKKAKKADKRSHASKTNKEIQVRRRSNRLKTTTALNDVDTKRAMDEAGPSRSNTIRENTIKNRDVLPDDDIECSDDDNDFAILHGRCFTILHGRCFTGVGGSSKTSKHKRRRESEMADADVIGEIPDTSVVGSYDNDDYESLPRQRQSILRQHRRAEKKSEEEDRKNRLQACKKPFSVEVTDDGFIDGSCKDHERWKRLVRNLTPAVMTMSQDDITKQLGDLKRLRDLLFSKFEFLLNEVTADSFQKMIVKWMRQTKSRWRHTIGDRKHPPLNVKQKDWDDLRQIWKDEDFQKISQKMAAVRKCVKNPSKLGRRGVKGTIALARAQREVTPKLTEEYGILKSSEDMSITQEPNKRMASRMTAIERTQLEVDRKLAIILHSHEKILGSLKIPSSNNEINTKLPGPLINLDIHDVNVTTLPLKAAGQGSSASALHDNEVDMEDGIQRSK